MPRLTPDKEKKHRAQIAFFKWEFLRRNRRYAKVYADLMARGRKALRRSGYPKPGFADHLDDKLRERIGTCHAHWEVGFMQDPKVRVPLKAMKESREDKSKNPFWASDAQVLIGDAEILGPDLARFKSPSVNLWLNRFWLPIAVNVQERPAELLRKLKRLIEAAHAKAHRRNVPKPIRVEPKTFDVYLRIWDLRSRGLDDDQIIARVPQARVMSEGVRYAHRADSKKDCVLKKRRGPRPSSNPKVRFVRRCIRMADRLIDDEYRFLS